MKSLILLFLAICITGYLFDTHKVHAQPPDTLAVKAEVDNMVALGDSLRGIWQTDAALDIYQEALVLAQQAGNKEQFGEINHNLGQAHFNKGNFKQALAYWEKALYQYHQADDKRGEADALCNMSMVYIYLANFHKTLSYCQKSLDICKKIGYTDGEARALSKMGEAWYRLAFYSDALNIFQQSLEIYRSLGNRSGEAETLLNIGAVYSQLNDLTKVNDYIEMSQKLYDEVGDQIGKLKVLLAERPINRLDGKNEIFEKYEDAYKKALDLSRELGNRYYEALSIQYLGITYYYWGYRTGGKFTKGLDYYFPALEMFREMGCRLNEANMLEYIALNYFQQAIILVNHGKYQEILTGDLEKQLQAKDRYKEALSIYESIDADQNTQIAYVRLGRCYGAMRRFKESSESYLNSVEALERIRSRLYEVKHETKFFDYWDRGYHYAIKDLYRIGKCQEIYKYIEMIRARSFLDMIASDEVKVGKSKHAMFLKKEAEFKKYKAEMEKKIACSDDTIQIATLRGQLEQEWQSIDALVDEKERYEPELVSLTKVNSLDLQEIQNLLDDKNTMLEYYYDDEVIFLFMITSKKTQLFKLTESPVSGYREGLSIRDEVRGFRDAIMTGGEIERRSRKLYNLLFAPVEDLIETKNLVIIPNNFLHYLPFQALKDEHGKYLLEKYCISYMPSASMMKYLKNKNKKKGDKLLAFGNPRTGYKDYKSIPLAAEEVKNIQQLYEKSTVFIGAEATEDNFQRWAPEYNILHLACHSELNAEKPLFSSLLLAPRDENDGRLEVHEIFTMDLKADLVVLSACQTALGNLTKGDELVGLSRAFIYAGTPTVLSSLWVIQDESTSYLMTEFYKNLRKYSKAEALRRAQRSTKKKYSSPYHWASFVLIGDPG